MSAFSKLFSKKKEFKAVCDLSRQQLDKNSVYLVSTAEIISSKKFWDNKMTEPDTMTYTEAHFKTGDSTALNIRRMIYNKFSAADKAWVISDSQLHLFDIDEVESKSLAEAWWDSEGNEIPDMKAKSLHTLDPVRLGEIEDYAIMEAGRRHVAA